MNGKVSIAIIGMGNVGWNLALRLQACGYAIQQVVSSSVEKDDPLLTELKAEVITQPASIQDTVDLAIVCVPDDAVRSTINAVPDGVAVAHTSGSTPLSYDRPRSGVLYPFQTFTRGVKPDWDGIPVFVESNDDQLLELLRDIGYDLSGNVDEKDSDQRRIIHISGVFGANFVNHVMYLASKVLERGDTSFNVLKPLLEEVLRKALEHGPKNSQTGPARRGDKKLIDRHLELLKDDESLSSIYRELSESIMKTYAP